MLNSQSTHIHNKSNGKIRTQEQFIIWHLLKDHKRLFFYPLQNITTKLNSSLCYYHFNLPTGSSSDMTKIISIYDALKLLKNSVERE